MNTENSALMIGIISLLGSALVYFTINKQYASGLLVGIGLSNTLYQFIFYYLIKKGRILY